MNVIKFVAIIALISNGVYCYIPHGDLDLTSLPKPVHFPLQQSPTDLNNRPIYDSGIGKLNEHIHVIILEKILIAIYCCSHRYQFEIG